MIEHYWTVLCSNSVIDSESNNISLLNVLEQINIQDTPPEKGEIKGLPFPSQIVTLWGRSDVNQPERGTARYTVQYTHGGETSQTEPNTSPVDLTEYRRMRTRTNMPVLPIMGAGVHKIIVEIQSDPEEEWIQVAALSYDVQFAPDSSKN